MAPIVPKFSIVVRTLQRADALRRAVTHLIFQDYECPREEHDSSGGSLVDRLMSDRDGIAQSALEQLWLDRQATDVVARGEDGVGGAGKRTAPHSMFRFETTDGGLDGGAPA